MDPVSRIRCLFDPWSGMYNPERILFDGDLDPGSRIFLFRDGKIWIRDPRSATLVLVRSIRGIRIRTLKVIGLGILCLD